MNQIASDHFFLVWCHRPQMHLLNLSSPKLSITSTPFLLCSVFLRRPLHLIFILCDQHQLKFHSNFIISKNLKIYYIIFKEMCALKYFNTVYQWQFSRRTHICLLEGLCSLPLHGKDKVTSFKRMLNRMLLIIQEVTHFLLSQNWSTVSAHCFKSFLLTAAAIFENYSYLWHSLHWWTHSFKLYILSIIHVVIYFFSNFLTFFCHICNNT